VVVVLDATNLQRNLYLATQVLEVGLPVVLALNLSDDAVKRGITIDAEALGAALGARAVRTVAHRGEGTPELTRAIVAALEQGAPPAPLSWPPALLAAEAELAVALPGLTALERRRALLDVGGEAEARAWATGPTARAALEHARERLRAAGHGPGLEAGVRYGFLAPLVARCVTKPAVAPLTPSDRIDAWLTHRLFGTLGLVVIMALVFMAIFAWAEPLMGLIEEGLIGGLSTWVAGLEILGDGLFKSLLVDGILAGVGGVLVFLPQIVILFGLLALLEGCGYMARAAFLMDRLLRGVGLSGRSFIPMLSSFACAIPGIMATRTIDSRRDRIATILVAPLMSCSARIPVYVILIGAFVPATTVLGFLPLQGLVFTAMYFVGILVAIPVAFLLKRTLLKGDTPSFLVELPPYRVPRARVVASAMWRNGREFVVRAGTLILATSIVVWALGTFPRHPDPGAEGRAEVARFDAAEKRAAELRGIERAAQEQARELGKAQPPAVREAVEEAFGRFEAAEREQLAAVAVARDELLQANDVRAVGAQQRQSYLGRMGHFVEPVFEPLGWDWKVSMAVIASFPAREVVVGTLGVIYDLGDEADAESESLRQRLKDARWESGPKMGRPVFDLASALALMVFFALCAQCASTLVVIRRETGRWAWAGFTFVYMTALAWVGAWITVLLVRAVT
jgi:ferrous iron transport protein B